MKIGSVYTMIEEMPDDYDCFTQQIETFFPCLAADYKPPANRKETGHCEGYSCFYIDKDENTVPMRDNLEYRGFMKSFK